MKKFVALAIILGMAFFGCAEKKPVPTLQPEEVKTPVQTKDIEKPKTVPQKVTDDEVKVETREVAPKVEEIPGMFKDVYFDYDKYHIREDAKTTLKAVADYLIKNSANKMLVEGHCDDRGTSEYNLGLGDKRAKAVKDYLISLGVPSSRIDSISYGKEKPLCNDQKEDCWAKNRRAHFVILKGKS
ncbi:MAG TPA: peptidoglycan-associated lipoprotein Pal [Thermodesulfovibrionales bacterium]|nr:peptidoglycan-associated lipoprotein Pal [Thermodesulfovibrionales bacterium]